VRAVVLAAALAATPAAADLRACFTPAENCAAVIVGEIDASLAAKPFSAKAD
jgi:ABC-type nitrate/sulfonate/bicarbonate transport system substrate-binding protein